MNETSSSRRVATRVAKNTVAQLVAMGSTIISKLLITIVIGRVFGPAAVGDFAFVITFSTLFNFLASLGLPVALIRETATHRQEVDRYAGNSVTLVGLTGLATIPLMWAVSALLGKPAVIQQAVVLAGIALACDGLAQTLGGVFNGLERMELAAAVIIAQETTFALFGAAVILLHQPLLWVYAVYVPSRLAGLLMGLVLYRRSLGHWLRPRSNWPFIRQLVRISIPYAASVALAPVYVRIDVVMLYMFQNSADVGLYEAATSIFYRFTVFARMFTNALLPLMAREFATQEKRIRTYLHAAARYLAAFGIPLTVWCVILADQLIALLFGEQFETSALIFRLLAPLITLRFLSNALVTALTAANRQTSRSIIIALAAVGNIAMNLYALPRYSYLGATITSILTEVLFFTASYVALRRDIPRPLGRRFLLKPAAAGTLMAAVTWLLRGLGTPQSPFLAGLTAWISRAPLVGSADTNLVQWLASAVALVLLMILTGVAYLVGLAALGTFSREEWHWLLQVTRLYRLAPRAVRARFLREIRPQESVEKP